MHAFAQRLVAVSFLAFAWTAFASSDMETVKQRFLAELIPTNASALNSTVKNDILPHFNASCLFDDIDYASQRRAGWPVMAHLGRLVSMAQLAAATRSQAVASSLVGQVVCGLNWWLVVRPVCPNWYDQQISGPNNIGSIVLLLPSGALEANQSTAAKELISEATWWKGWTGSNLLFMLRAQLMRGLFFSNTTAVEQAFQVGFEAMRTFDQDDDGPQKDNSFHQHGPQLLAGSYGAEFTGHVLEFAFLATGTQWQAPNTTLAALSSLLLDGQQYMMIFAPAPAQDVTWDWQVVGRSTSVEGSGHFDPRGFIQTSFVDGVAANNASGRQDDWKAFAARLAASSDAKPLAGAKSFWDSDFVAHAPSGGRWRYSLHMQSSRTIGGACVNDQGKLSRRKSLGASAIYYTGFEYAGIYPLWDFYRPPGVTAPVNDGFHLECGNAKTMGGSAFVGGVSLPSSAHSVAVMDVEAEGELSGHRSWFLFDKSVVMLGSRLSPHHSGAELDTTLDTARLQGDVFAGNATQAALGLRERHPSGDTVHGGGSVVSPRLRAQVRSPLAPATLPRGNHTIPLFGDADNSTVTWLLHGKTAFLLPASVSGPVAPTQLRVTNDRLSGTWSKIGVNDGNVSADMFDAVVAHNAPSSGQSGASSASYAVVVVPDVSGPEEAQSTAAQLAGLAISRAPGKDASSFAAQEGVFDAEAKVAGIAFWEANSGETGPQSVDFAPLQLAGQPDWLFGASQPCVVVASLGGADGSTFTMSLATPGVGDQQVSVFVNHKLSCSSCSDSGNGWTEVKVKTPGSSSDKAMIGAPVVVSAVIESSRS